LKDVGAPTSGARTENSRTVVPPESKPIDAPSTRNDAKARRVDANVDASDPVADALARSLETAVREAQWDLVAVFARELEGRKRARQPAPSASERVVVPFRRGAR
jgi:hypothetical protein